MRRGFVAGFTLSAALVLFISGFSILELRRAQRLAQDDIHQDQLMLALGAVEAAFERKSTALRDYLLSGDRRLLDEASAARREFQERIGGLQRLSVERQSRTLIERLSSAERAHKQAWEPILRSIDSGSPRESATYYLQEIAPHRAAVLQDLRALTDFETRMLERLHRSAEGRLFRTALVVLAVGGGALLLTLVLTWLLARKLTGLYEQEQAERQRAERTTEALRRSEEQLRAVFEGALDPMVIADDAGRFVDANLAASELFGVPRDRLLGRSVAEFTRFDYPFEEAWTRFQHEGSMRGEFEVLRPDGSTRDTEFSATANVQPGRHLSALRDVTERKRSEEVIQESAELRAAIIASALDAIVTIDGEGRVLEFNPAAEAVFGYSREEAVGREMAALIIPPALRQKNREGMARYLAGGEGPVLGRRLEMPAIRRDGTEFPVELSIVRLPGEGPPVFTGFLRDITERRQAEAERISLLNLERKARAAAETAEVRSTFLAEASALLASSLDYVTTLQRVARLVVPRMADWCAVDILDDEGGLAPLALSHVDPNKVELVRELTRRFPRSPDAPAGPAHVVRTGKAEVVSHITDEMLRAATRGGEHYRIVRDLGLTSYVCVPLEARGQILGALTFVSDSAARRYESGDVPFLESLAQRASLAIDNARLFRQAREAVRLRDDFLSIASHELKTPVTTLQLQLQSLLRRIPVEEGEGLGGRLETAQRQVERLQKLIEKLLDISRLTSGRLELELEPVDLHAVVHEVVGRFEEELRRSATPITVRGEAPSMGHWDRSRLDQVVTNLLSNAIKYGDSKPVVVTLDGDERAARLEVRDHGIGIAPHNLPRIFERFERAVSQRHYGGLGLGLWIVRQAVEALGGTVHAASTPGAGSAFTVELPRGPRRQDARAS